MSRDAIVDIAWEGMSRPISFPAPTLAALTPFFEGTEDLFAQYPNTEFDPKATEALMTEAGYTKGADGFWADASGTKLVVDLVARQTEADSGQGRPGGCRTAEARRVRRAVPPRRLGRLCRPGVPGQGQYLARPDQWRREQPLPSFDMFHSRHAAAIGSSATGSYSRYANPEYDKIVDEMGKLATDDPKFKDLVRQALAIWLRDLPVAPTTDAALLASYNHTYWKNWPTSTTRTSSPASGGPARSSRSSPSSLPAKATRWPGPSDPRHILSPNSVRL